MLLPRTVADVMTDDVCTFTENISIEAAARTLTRRQIAGAPVVSTTGRPVGVVTLADLLAREHPHLSRNGYPLFYRITDDKLEPVTEKLPASESPVTEVMSPFVLSIESTATIPEAASRMIGEDVHRLLVMQNGSLVGIVTSIDLLRGFTMLMRA